MVVRNFIHGAYATVAEKDCVEAPVTFEPEQVRMASIQFYDIDSLKRRRGKYQVFIDVPPDDKSYVGFGIAFLPTRSDRKFLGHMMTPSPNILAEGVKTLDYVLTYFDCAENYRGKILSFLWEVLGIGKRKYDRQKKAHITMDEANTENLKKYLNGQQS